MTVLVSANIAPAMKSMDAVGDKVKDVGQTSQREGAKTEGFMKRWGSSFAAIGAAATASLYMVVKASPLLSGAMQEAQDAISLLFMTIGDALEPVIRPFVDAIWAIVDAILNMPAPLNALTATLIVFGGVIATTLTGLAALPTLLHSIGLAATAAASPALLLAAGFSWIVVAAGLVAAALYYVSGEPTVAIVGALTAIGVGASVLLHHPVVFAITSIVSAFVMLAGEAGNMETLASVAFIGIGMAATTLMGHPVVAAIAGIGYAIAVLIQSSADFEIKVIAVFTAIGLAAWALLANPVIAAIVAIVDAIYLLTRAYNELGRIMGGRAAELGIEELSPWNRPSIFPLWQQGGYVPFTGPGILHAGEYVVPAGRVGAGVGGGYTDNRAFNFDIHDVTLAGDMDIDRLKQRLDELYKKEMGGVA